MKLAQKEKIRGTKAEKSRHIDQDGRHDLPGQGLGADQGDPRLSQGQGGGGQGVHGEEPAQGCGRARW